eukprot:2051557-Rhodomonas_salina.1
MPGYRSRLILTHALCISYATSLRMLSVSPTLPSSARSLCATLPPYTRSLYLLRYPPMLPLYAKHCTYSAYAATSMWATTTVPEISKTASGPLPLSLPPVSYTHLRAHETEADL